MQYVVTTRQYHVRPQLDSHTVSHQPSISNRSAYITLRHTLFHYNCTLLSTLHKLHKMARNIYCCFLQ